MKFKVNQIAAAVAVSLGTAVVGMSAAQADEILFPYIVTSGTVTTLVSVMNNAGTFAGDQAPTELHYRYYYKNGPVTTTTGAENNAALCTEVDRSLPSSANDIVTFDVSGTFKKDNLNILFEDVKVSTLPDGKGRGYGNTPFGLLGGITQPARAFLLVDNDDFASQETFFRTSESLAGEAIILEFVNGAAWGYSAYNSAGRYNSNLVRINLFDFSDYVETAGEVIANESGEGYAPVAIAPRRTAAGADDVITKFFVTPISPSRPTAAGWVPGNQLAGNLIAGIGLVGEFDRGLGTSVAMYDRDEGPVSGRVLQGVVCVGAVDVKSLLSEAALNQVPQGGWSDVVTLPENLLPTTVNGNAVARTAEAVVIKLEYNTPTSPSLTTVGIINNGIWLRRGLRESIPTPANEAQARVSLYTVGDDINAPQPSGAQ